MQIQNVLSGYADRAMKAQAELSDTLAGKTDADQSKPEAAAGVSSAMAARNVLQTYDVTEITPKQLTEMIQRLFDVGVITQQELEQLAAIRLDLDLAGIDPDESIDLLQFYHQKVADLHRRRSDVAAVPDALRRRLDWIEKFALVQAASGPAGVDSTV